MTLEAAAREYRLALEELEAAGQDEQAIRYALKEAECRTQEAQQAVAGMKMGLLGLAERGDPAVEAV